MKPLFWILFSIFVYCYQPGHVRAQMQPGRGRAYSGNVQGQQDYQAGHGRGDEWGQVPSHQARSLGHNRGHHSGRGSPHRQSGDERYGHINRHDRGRGHGRAMGKEESEHDKGHEHIPDTGADIQKIMEGMVEEPSGNGYRVYVKRRQTDKGRIETRVIVPDMNWAQEFPEKQGLKQVGSKYEENDLENERYTLEPELGSEQEVALPDRTFG